MKEKIRAKVALVADAEQVVVNLGRASGVQVGNKMYLLRETEIFDPDFPEEVLGTAFIQKGTMVIESVEEKFSTARVLKTRKNFMSPADPTFLIVDSDLHESLDRVHVRIGDPVDILIDTEFDLAPTLRD